MLAARQSQVHDGQKYNATLLNGDHGSLAHDLGVGHRLDEAITQGTTQPRQLMQPRVTSHLVKNFINIVRAMQLRVTESSWIQLTPLAIESSSSSLKNMSVHAMMTT